VAATVVAVAGALVAAATVVAVAGAVVGAAVLVGGTGVGGTLVEGSATGWQAATSSVSNNTGAKRRFTIILLM
jgi:hypothetical protein